jgi:hypothetical protein
VSRRRFHSTLEPIAKSVSVGFGICTPRSLTYKAAGLPEQRERVFELRVADYSSACRHPIPIGSCRQLPPSQNDAWYDSMLLGVLERPSCARHLTIRGGYLGIARRITEHRYWSFLVSAYRSRNAGVSSIHMSYSSYPISSRCRSGSRAAAGIT